MSIEKELPYLAKMTPVTMIINRAHEFHFYRKPNMILHNLKRFIATCDKKVRKYFYINGMLRFSYTHYQIGILVYSIVYWRHNSYLIVTS